MKLSNQALTCVMVALQKSLMEQTDIVPLLMGFELEEQKGELFVKNPPNTIVSKSETLTFEEK